MSDIVLEEFQIECLELLEVAEDSLLNLEDQKGDVDENYNNVFRVLHNLKGTFGMFNIPEMQRHFHIVEEEFESFRKNIEGLRCNIDYFLRALDFCKGFLEGSRQEFDYQKTNKLKPKKDSAANSTFQGFVVCGEETDSFINYIESTGIDIPFLQVEKESFLRNGSGGQLCALVYAGKDDEILNAISKNNIPLLVYTDSKITYDTSKFVTVIGKHTLPDLGKVILRMHFMSSSYSALCLKSNKLLMYLFGDLTNYFLENNRSEDLNLIKEETREILISRTKVLKWGK